MKNKQTNKNSDRPSQIYVGTLENLQKNYKKNDHCLIYCALCTS